MKPSLLTEPDLNYPDINTMLQRIGYAWGYVELVRLGLCWQCRAHTDEGLGALFSFKGDYPTQAVIRAYRTIKRLYEHPK